METIIWIIYSQLILIPILGGIWMGIRNERKEYTRLLTLAIASASRRR